MDQRQDPRLQPYQLPSILTAQGLGAGGIAGIVVLCCVVVAAGGYAAYRLRLRSMMQASQGRGRAVGYVTGSCAREMLVPLLLLCSTVAYVNCCVPTPLPPG